jgi:hypothetical protein
MIIDTYVYFVSYKHYDKNSDGNGDAVMDMDRKILNREDLEAIRDSLKGDHEKIVFINFQLLDSYNKEEREAKEQNKKDAV